MLGKSDESGPRTDKGIRQYYWRFLCLGEINIEPEVIPAAGAYAALAAPRSGKTGCHEGFAPGLSPISGGGCWGGSEELDKEHQLSFRIWLYGLDTKLI